MAGGVSGLQVMGVAEYLSTHWPQLGELTALVESLEASLQGGGAEREERRGEHSEHLPEQALLEGVKKVCVCMGGRCECECECVCVWVCVCYAWEGGRCECECVCGCGCVCMVGKCVCVCAW